VSNTRGYEGSGLGLSIVKGLLKLLNGKIWFESKKDEGSTFFIELPLEDNVVNLNDEVSKELLVSDKSKPVILIAEDDDLNYLYLETIVKDNMQIIHALNGVEAIELCRNHPEIDIVVMDIKMPVMNGIDATIEIKKFRKNLPIIALTAYAQIGDKKRCMDAGCDDYISKPIKKDEFLLKLVNYF